MSKQGKGEALEAAAVLKAVANPNNQAILNLLAVEPTYPRRIAELLSAGETGVARRLKRMEGIGLVESEWAYVGKNVKIYRLVPEALRVGFTTEGLAVDVIDPGGQRRSATVVQGVSAPLPSLDAFVGREQELATLEGAGPVIVIDGMPGIGKSTLAAAYAEQARQDHDVFFHRFRGTESVTWLASRFGVALAEAGDRTLLEAVEEGAAVPDLTDLLLQAIDREGRVTVLDDVHRVEDEAIEDLLLEAVDATTQGKLLLTGRERITYNPSLDHVTRLHLTGLDDEAVAAFVEAEGFELEPDHLPRLREEVGGHPLALALFLEAARAPKVEVEDLLDKVPEEDLEAWLLGEVEATLSEGERTLLAHASLFRDTFTERDLRAIETRDPTGPLLRLRKRHLVSHTGDAYRLHEVLANFFRGKLAEPRELHDQLARHYLSKGTPEARLEAMHHHLEAGRRTRVLSLIEEDLDLEEFDAIDTGYHNLYLEILDRFDEAEIHDPRRAALVHDEKGDIRFHRGEHERALTHHERAADLFEELGDDARLADLAWKRALSLAALARDDQARKIAEAGLAHASEAPQARERLERFLEDA